MARWYRCELCKIFWEPNLERGDRLLAGLMMWADEISFTGVRVTTDYARLRSYHPAVDLGFLAALEKQLQADVQDPESRARIREKLFDWASNAVQFSAPTALLATDPAAEFARLAKRCLETPRIVSKRTPNGRARILSHMKDIFKRYDVLQHMEKVNVNDYVPRDPLVIDLSYPRHDCRRPADVAIKQMFHAVAVDRDVNAAKSLAFSYQRMRDEVFRRDSIPARLTAVIDDCPDLTSSPVADFVDVFMAANINLAMLSQLPQYAAVARDELRL
jgi:hypothetical protein